MFHSRNHSEAGLGTTSISQVICTLKITPKQQPEATRLIGKAESSSWTAGRRTGPCSPPGGCAPAHRALRSWKGCRLGIELYRSSHTCWPWRSSWELRLECRRLKWNLTEFQTSVNHKSLLIENVTRNSLDTPASYSVPVFQL